MPQKLKKSKNNRIIFLYGRLMGETCGVRDYGICLGETMRLLGIYEKHIFVCWDKNGWLRELYALRNQFKCISPSSYVILHYTALSWSKKGFPFMLILVIWIIRFSKCRLIVVFHDPHGHPGKSFPKRVRRGLQHILMRYLIRYSDHPVTTVPVEVLHWIPQKFYSKVSVIPVGSNIRPKKIVTNNHGLNKRILVFGMDTLGAFGRQQQEFVTEVIRLVASNVPEVHLDLVGKDSCFLAEKIKTLLRKESIYVHGYGVKNEDDMSRIFIRADVQFFPRGGIGANRGTVIAGIAHSLPIVAEESSLLASPLSKAGIVTFKKGDSKQAAEHIITVLSNQEEHERLTKLSRNAYHKYFVWNIIAKSFLDIMKTSRCGQNS